MIAGRIKFLNDHDKIVDEMLDGWVMANPEIIKRNADGHIARTTPKAEGNVALVIGNGTGHEPAMVGLVGPGLLDVNVPGPIFAAPSASEIAKGIRAADRGAGVLLCVSNHEGDVLAAELAAEIIDEDASGPDLKIAILGEDVGVSVSKRSDRRGGAGLLFVWKMLGAFAEQGHSLDDCTLMAIDIASKSASMSATLTSGSHPISGAQLAEIPEGYVLVGSGVHGEGSVTQEFVSVDKLVPSLIDALLGETGIPATGRVALMVNNSGSLTDMELAIISRSARLELERRSITVERTWFGAYATTQESAGFALAVCDVNEELLDLYDAPAFGASCFTGTAS
jgi:dihydroxyacetone kinase-like protein